MRLNLAFLDGGLLIIDKIVFTFFWGEERRQHGRMK